MRRILAIIVLAAILVLALSVPALAKPSDPPNAFGEYNSWLVQTTNEWLDENGYQNGYGRCYNAPIRWAIWWSNHGGVPVPWENGGEYVAATKEYASY